ncbi:MAG: alpha/beta hydrolase [Planctomycetota bacterium]
MVGLLLLALAGLTYENERWGFVFELPPGWSEAPLPARDPYAVARFAPREGKAEILIVALPTLPDGNRLTYTAYLEPRRWAVSKSGGGFALRQPGWRGRTWIREFDDVHFAIQLRADADRFAKWEAECERRIESFERIVVVDPEWRTMSFPVRSLETGGTPAWAGESTNSTTIDVFYATTRERVGDRVGGLARWLAAYLLLGVATLVLGRRFHRIPVWCAIATIAALLLVFSALDGFPLLLGAALLLAFLLPPTLRCLLRRRWRWMVPTSRVLLAAAAVVAFVLFFNREYQTWDQQRRVKLAYGTGRADYDNEWGCETGVATVNVPEDREEGEIPRPAFGLPDPAEHFLVAGVEVLDTAEFRRRITARAGMSERKDAMLFVHGYNNTFNDALFRAAQIAHDLRYRGAPMLFSWPSKGDFLRYSHDEAEVTPASRALGRVIAGLQKTEGIEHLYVVAHSMGCRVLGRAMQWMRSQGANEQLDVIVLAAPDIDEKAYREVIAPEMKKRTQRPTLYVSRNDGALKASYGFHGYRRAGDAAPTPIVVDGIDTIDVSRISADHSYIGSNHRVMSDLDVLLQKLERATARMGPGSALRLDTALGFYWIDDLR